MPGRASLGIAPDDKYYYPAHVEYGHPLVRGGRIVGHVPPKSYIRSTVNANEDTELRTIGTDIGKGIDLEWAKR